MLRYKKYRLIKPNLEQEKRICEIIINQNGSVFHEVELNRIVESTFRTQLFYLVDNPQKISCFSPVHITKNKYGFRRYHFKPLYDIPYAGFLGDCKFNLKQLSLGFFESCSYKGFPFQKEIMNNLKELRIGQTSMINLSLDEDEIFNKVIHSKRRNMIRKALKSGISVKKYFTIEGLDEFWPILDQLHKRLGYSNLSFDYYNQIFQNYESKKQSFIIVAYKEDKPISGAFILGNKNFMHYYKGASLINVKNEGQGELLQWEAIKVSKRLSANYYDLCNLDKNKLPAIYRFKTGISNNKFKYHIYNKNNFGHKILNGLSKI